jgi:hypothetical protein
VRAGYGVFNDAPEMYILNKMKNQTPFSFTVSFQDGLFDNPYQGRQNLNVFPYSGYFSRNSMYQLPTPAVVYDPVWNSLTRRIGISPRIAASGHEFSRQVTWGPRVPISSATAMRTRLSTTPR